MLGLPSSASAQSEPVELGTDGAPDAEVFGGVLVGSFITERSEKEDESRPGVGWELGGSYYPLDWLGLTGSLARVSEEDADLHQYLGGVRFSTAYSDYYMVRGFAHVLVGAASVNAPGESEPGSELVLGVGWEIFLMRLQFDYMRLNIDSPLVGKNLGRIFLGGVVPICFRRCTWRAA